MKLIKLGEIFKVFYGVNLSLSEIELANNGIPFVSRANRNNGVTAKVLPIEGIKPNPAHTISVAVGGSVMSSFYQDKPYYSSHDVFYLQPMVNLTKAEMLLYCTFLRLNKYKYNYGRQANKSLESLYVPDVESVSKCLNSLKIQVPSRPSLIKKQVAFDTRQWKSFRYGEIFTIKRGSYNRKLGNVENGSIPLIGATKFNNGVISKLNTEIIEQASKDSLNNNHEISKKIFKGKRYITTSNNGSIGCPFYQPIDFACSQDVNLVELKHVKLNTYIALFLCTLIKLDRYRWAYGRKCIPLRMCESKIKLPIDAKGTPDWQFMENYIKSLPYTSSS